MNPRRLLVVAPHPDDDTIGCGGLIASVAARGGAVRVIYVTDGSASHRTRRYPPHLLAEMREREALAALAALGVGDEPVFLRLADGSPPTLSQERRAATVARIAAEIEAFAPELVLGPWLRDPHPDHVASAEMTRAAAGIARVSAELGYYEVWLPIRGAVSDHPLEGETRITSFALDGRLRECKRRALFEHRSQTGLIDDDPEGFRIGDDLVARWVGTSERFYFPVKFGVAASG